MNFSFDLQLFGGKGGDTTVTNTSTYTPTPYELQLQRAQAEYANAISPNSLWLNNTARSILEDSIGAVQVDYDSMNNKAQSQIAGAQAGLQNLANGQLPSAYTQNMADAIRSGVENTYGNLLNQSAQRGTLNSSVTTKGLNNISQNVADTMASSFNNNVNTLANLYGSQIGSAASGITTAAAAQEAAQAPATNLWNASLGLNGSTTGALAAAAGQGTRSSTQTQSGGNGGFWGGLLGAGISAFCFPAGTMIHMGDGTQKDIKDIKVGDQVLGRDGKIEKVINKMPPHRNIVYRVRMNNGESVRTTMTQPFMMDNDGWRELIDLEPGDKLKRMGKIETIIAEGVMDVHDFETDGENTYIVDGGFIAKGGNFDIWGR